MLDEYLKALVAQVRAIDTYDRWANIPDEKLLTERYIKSKEELKALGVVCKPLEELQLAYIKMVFKAVATLFEKRTGEMASVICEMNMAEGFGRIVVFADEIVLIDKTLRDAQKYSFESLEKLSKEIEKMLNRAIETYTKYKDKR